MDYNSDLWNTYTLENESKIQLELSKFIYFSSVVLGAKKICEIGCNAGNNLSSFPKDLEIHGIDMNKMALQKAKEQYPQFIFKEGNITKIPYPDSFFDLVFTRGVLIHIDKKKLEIALEELLRVSKSWILNLEYYGVDEKMIDWKRGKDLLWYRNMKENWKNFEVEIISDVEIPQTIDSGRTHLTLVRKK